MAFDKRRFIAGAVCPRCEEMDKIVVYSEAGKEFRECVSCGFKDEMRFQQHVRELDTRVNQTEEVKQAETQVLQFPPLGTDK
ncbi:MAG: YheV family putative zinc ribbon protein [Candidatus Pelagadaptatus aseana]|uniref:YheV family putative zinc ribbon protein n=1 Tax=Candidatus Pelagadaptatus aseana TaxID=3120508 RepID=UPI0039B22E6B